LKWRKTHRQFIKMITTFGIRILILNICLILFFSVYGQPIHDPVEFFAIDYGDSNINYLDKDSLKQGRFVFTPLTCTDTNKCKIVAFFKDDTVVSKWTYYQPDSTYETGKYRINKKFTRKGGLTYTYPMKIHKWYHYNSENELLYYISHNPFYDKKDRGLCWNDTIYDKEGKIIGHDIKKGAYNREKERYVYQDDTLISYVLHIERKLRTRNIETKYYESGVIWIQVKNNISKTYHPNGELQEYRKKKTKHKRGSGVGEKYSHYSVTREKVKTYDNSGKKIKFEKYKNGKLIKEQQYTKSQTVD